MGTSIVYALRVYILYPQRAVFCNTGTIVRTAHPWAGLLPPAPATWPANLLPEPGPRHGGCVTVHAVTAAWRGGASP